MGFRHPLASFSIFSEVSIGGAGRSQDFAAAVSSKKGRKRHSVPSFGFRCLLTTLRPTMTCFFMASQSAVLSLPGRTSQRSTEHSLSRMLKTENPEGPLEHARHGKVNPGATQRGHVRACIILHQALRTRLLRASDSFVHVLALLTCFGGTAVQQHDDP